MSGMPLNCCVNSDGTEAKFMTLVPSIVGVPEIEYDEFGNSVVAVPVENEEKLKDSLVVFSAYNNFGKMTDVKFAYGSSQVDCKISRELEVSGAVKVTVFVFDNISCMNPLTQKLEIFDFN